MRILCHDSFTKTWWEVYIYIYLVYMPCIYIYTHINQFTEFTANNSSNIFEGNSGFHCL